MSWKEYAFTGETVNEGLPWGGLIHPNILRNKDGSFLGIIQFNPNGDAAIDFVGFQCGWSLWTECQTVTAKQQTFLVLCCNPFKEKNSPIKNVLRGKPVPENAAQQYFVDELMALQKAVNAVTACHVLEGQEIFDFLSFSLSLGRQHIEMPEVPLYLDTLLSQDLHIKFAGNDVWIGDSRIMALSLPGGLRPDEMKIICNAFGKIPYRHVQRLLFLPQKKAKEDLRQYVRQWCSGRRTIRNVICANLLSTLNGYYSNAFFFLIEDEKYEMVQRYCTEILDSLHLPYVIEDYNRKDVWWGSIPGCYRANITAPVTGWSNLAEIAFLYRKNGDQYV